eukprot:351841-Chlamydomonas_euryale.AAC.9
MSVEACPLNRPHPATPLPHRTLPHTSSQRALPTGTTRCLLRPLERHAACRPAPAGPDRGTTPRCPFPTRTLCPTHAHAGLAHWNDTLLVDLRLAGLVEAWAAGATWAQIMEDSSLDDGDVARLLMRTVDLLRQVWKMSGGRVCGGLRGVWHGEAVHLMPATLRGCSCARSTCSDRCGK